MGRVSHRGNAKAYTLNKDSQTALITRLSVPLP